ncbi:MAG TPA: hypothetical protein EYP07_04415, partial [Kiloniellaceae bacterium]|nr:hypothetical protein [Kiloniellaceae bacterium]
MPKRLASTATLPLGDGAAETQAQTPAQTPAQAQPRRAAVLLPLPLAGAYDYLVPEDLEVEPGSVVTVPLGQRELFGVVWELLPEDGRPAADDGGGKALPLERLRPVIDVCPVPPLTAVARRFLAWVSDYTLAAPGAVLRMALSSPSALEPPRPVTLYRRAEQPLPADLRLTPARRRVLEEMEESPARPLAEIAAAAGVGTSVVKGLEKAGVVEA